MRYSVGDNRIDLVLDEGGTSSLWWATKNEWLGLLDIAGLELEDLYGGFPRSPSKTTAASTFSLLVALACDGATSCLHGALARDSCPEHVL